MRKILTKVSVAYKSDLLDISHPVIISRHSGKRIKVLSHYTDLNPNSVYNQPLRR